MSARAVLFALCATASLAAAQGSVRGRVYSAGAPLRGAVVSLSPQGRTTTTDSLGRFEFLALAGDSVTVVARAIGFRADSVTLALRGAVNRDFTLTAIANAQPLSPVDVVTSAARGPMVAFEERRKQGIGHFVDRAMLEKWSDHRTSEVLATIPGVALKYAAGRAAVATTRAITNGRCAFCSDKPQDLLDGADLAAGARPACYMDVYLNGALVYQYGQNPPMPLFNLNDMSPELIEGIEVYSSTAQVPVQYNRTSSGCGVMLIWSRISKGKP